MSRHSAQAPASTSAMNNSGHGYTNNDVESIRQAQRAWRIAKRREMEEKARKKQFKQRASLEGVQGVQGTSPQLQVNPANTHMHLASYHAQVQQTHSAHMQPQTHRLLDSPPSPANVARAAHAAAAAAAARHRTSLHDPASSQPIDVNAAAVTSEAASVLDVHLSGKRSRLAMEEGTGNVHGDDTADAVAAAAAAVAHAAATSSHGDTQYAPAVAIASAASMGHPPGPQPATHVVKGTAGPEPPLNEDAHRERTSQLEAQRIWREQKRREIAMKKAKGASSKRGRKKTRTYPANPPMRPAGSAPLLLAPAQPIGSHQAMAVSAAFASGPAGTSSVQNQNVVGHHQAHQMVPDDPTAIYVRSTPSNATMRPPDEMGAAQQMDVEMHEHVAEEKTNVAADMVQDGDGAHEALQDGTAEMNMGSATGAVAHGDQSRREHQEHTTMPEAKSEGDVGAEGVSSGHVEKVTDGGLAEDQSAIRTELAEQPSDSVRDAADASVGTNPAKSEAAEVGAIDVSTAVVDNVEEDNKAVEAIAQATVQASAEATADMAEEEAVEEQSAVVDTAESLTNDASGKVADDMAEGIAAADASVTRVSPAAAVLAEETSALGATEEGNGDSGPGNGTAEGEKDGEQIANENGTKEDREIHSEEAARQDGEAPQEAKAEDGQDGFGVDGGEDIMTAAAWQSLDSISHT